MVVRFPLGAVFGAVLAAMTGAASAQTQVVKPPVSQAWIDVATFSGMGMPGMGMGGAGGANPMAMMGAMLGGGGGGHLVPEMETIFLITSPEFAPISSTIVRELHKYGADVSDYLPYSLEGVHAG